MKKRSRSQATIFFILVLVLIIIVVMVVMLTRFAAKKVTKQETLDAKEGVFDVQPIRNFVSECLTVITEDAITLMGKQGGYIYKSQCGTLIDYHDSRQGTFFIDFEGNRVSYNILKSKFAVGKYSAEPPTYPWTTFPYSDSTRSTFEYEGPGAFGTNKVPVINITFGKHSMQEQLMTYIESNIDNCLEDSVFEGQGFLVDKREKSIEVDINENDIIARLDYDMDVTNLATNQKTTVSTFLTKIPIRLGTIQSYIHALVEDEISDPNFKMITAGVDGFSVSSFRDVFNQDDIVVVTDSQTKINENLFTYTFAVKNRNPALFFIEPEKRLPRFKPGTISEPNVITEEIILEGSSPQFLDPDDDELFSYKIEPEVPWNFVIPEIDFTVEISDGELTDSQSITFIREAAAPNIPPTLFIPDQRFSSQENAIQIIIPQLTAYASDTETPLEDLTFAVKAQENTQIVSCSIQNEEQLVCILHKNLETISETTLQVSDGFDTAESTFRLIVSKFEKSMNNCGDNICDFKNESCETCPTDCGTCYEETAKLILKCGSDPITLCEHQVSCPEGYEWWGGTTNCGGKLEFNCYKIRFSESCEVLPSCEPGEIRMQETPCT